MLIPENRSKQLLAQSNNGDIRAMCGIFSTLTIKATERHHWHCSSFSLFLTLNRFHALLFCFHCWHWTGKYWLAYVHNLVSLFSHRCHSVKVIFSKVLNNTKKIIDVSHKTKYLLDRNCCALKERFSQSWSLSGLCYIKGTLMQISKSPNMFLSIQK